MTGSNEAEQLQRHATIQRGREDQQKATESDEQAVVQVSMDCC